jgi:hypothetical protein
MNRGKENAYCPGIFSMKKGLKSKQQLGPNPAKALARSMPCFPLSLYLLSRKYWAFIQSHRIFLSGPASTSFNGSVYEAKLFNKTCTEPIMRRCWARLEPNPTRRPRPMAGCSVRVRTEIARRTSCFGGRPVPSVRCVRSEGNNR